MDIRRSGSASIRSSSRSSPVQTGRSLAMNRWRSMIIIEVRGMKCEVRSEQPESCDLGVLARPSHFSFQPSYQLPLFDVEILGDQIRAQALIVQQGKLNTPPVKR